MTTRTGHITAIRLFAASVLLMAAAACTREDWSDCDPLLEIAFSFTHNAAGAERFSDEVTRLDVFIFDAEGCFVKSMSDEKTRFPQNYVMHTELPAEGDYTVVVVGNADNWFDMGNLHDYSQGCSSMQPGTTTLQDFRFLHKQIGAKQGDRINDLFHGIVQVKGLKADVTGRYKVPLTKNTNTLNITVSGLQNMVTRSLYPTVEAEARSCNGAYMFDNRPDDNAPHMTYAPFSRTTQGTDLKIQLSVLRLTTGCAMPLIITDKAVEIGKYELVGEILKNPEYNTDDDLDREDTFDIDITFDSAGSVTIEVNGWQTTGSGGIVG